MTKTIKIQQQTRIPKVILRIKSNAELSACFPGAPMDQVMPGSLRFCRVLR